MPYEPYVGFATSQRYDFEHESSAIPLLLISAVIESVGHDIIHYWFH